MAAKIFTHAEISAVLEIRGSVLFWRVTRGKARAGTPAGRLDKEGYIALQFSGVDMLAHRVIWLLTFGEWPTGKLDHKNGIKSDNAITNLRAATTAQNAMNAGPRADNRHGGKGVTPLPNGKWQAQIKAEGRHQYLGSFVKKDDALAAYAAAAKASFGEFAYGERAE